MVRDLSAGNTKSQTSTSQGGVGCRLWLRDRRSPCAGHVYKRTPKYNTLKDICTPSLNVQLTSPNWKCVIQFSPLRLLHRPLQPKCSSTGDFLRRHSILLTLNSGVNPCRPTDPRTCCIMVLVIQGSYEEQGGQSCCLPRLGCC